MYPHKGCLLFERYRDKSWRWDLSAGMWLPGNRVSVTLHSFLLSEHGYLLLLLAQEISKFFIMGYYLSGSFWRFLVILILHFETVNKLVHFPHRFQCHLVLALPVHCLSLDCQNQFLQFFVFFLCTENEPISQLIIYWWLTWSFSLQEYRTSSMLEIEIVLILPVCEKTVFGD